MTDRRRRFLEAYLSGPRGIGGTATRAAEHVGYAWPGKQGPRLTTFPEVAAAITAEVERRVGEMRRESRRRAREEADALFRVRPCGRGRYRKRRESM
ncbi:MAG: hypothetical protein NVSMB9_24590 [Isosphaeraceae bacterium]